MIVIIRIEKSEEAHLPNHSFEKDACYAAAPQAPLKLGVSCQILIKRT